MAVKPYNLIQGDCLEAMKTLEGNSIDACITDIPYGTTACKWDTIIPFEPMWEALKRIVKPNGAICLFGSQPFTSALIMSNPKMFKYEWIWDKQRGTDWQMSNKKPLKSHENIIIFGQESVNYFPQKVKRKQPLDVRNWKFKALHNGEHQANSGIKQHDLKIYTDKHPKTVIVISGQDAEINNTNRLHPTQKPLKLMQYLVKTYTQENEVVLDFTCGSGSTGVAALIEKRRFIGIENNEEYFKIAEARIKRANLEPCEIPKRQIERVENPNQAMLFQA